MKLHNTLTKQVEDFKPINPIEVKLYTCGPTVYSYYHIGNLRNAVFNDTLRRALESSKYTVKHVMNITDVGHLVSDEDEGEDKLEKRAKQEQKTVWEVAEYYIGAFKNDMKILGVLPPNGYHKDDSNYARATDFINQQIDLVNRLLDRKFAYQTEQAIYFNVAKLADYGKLSGQKLIDKAVGARADVITDPTKKHPQDFALWFFTVGRFADHAMHWTSPWGDGFPGWHLECSAIIHATLGEPIDIHTGGVDHIGTHHTNEIAQTEAGYGVKLANYWVHNEHLLVNAQKMAKSTGNYYTLKDVINKNFDPIALRLLFLQAHYRSQMNFTWESLDATASFLKHLQAWADLQHQLSDSKLTDELDKLINDTKLLMVERIRDDLDTPGAISALSKLVVYMQTNSITSVNRQAFQSILLQTDELLGLGLSNRPDISNDLKQYIKDRELARKHNDWVKSDELRQKLLEYQLEINDTADGPIWSRV